MAKTLRIPYLSFRSHKAKILSFQRLLESQEFLSIVPSLSLSVFPINGKKDLSATMGAPSKTVQVSDSFFYPENEEKDEKTTTPSFIFDAFEFALVVASYKFSFSDSCTSPVLAVVSFTVKIVLIDASRRRGHSFTPFFI